MNWLIRLTNKYITHDRDTAGDFGFRVLQHIPIGVLMGVASVIPFLGYGLLQLFLKYERNEDAHTLDQAWKDIFGAILGYSIATVSILIAGGVLLWRAYH